MRKAAADIVRVLVVDDQAAFRRAMSAVVDATEGFEVVATAATGEESVRVAAATAAQLVLMDVNLPGIDGTQASRAIVARDPATVVILLSTYEAEDIALRRCGAAAYVPKADLSPDRLRREWDLATPAASD